MSLTFPRDMPASGPAGQYFEPEQTDYLSPSTGGSVGAVSAGPPLWRGRWTLAQGAGAARADVWRAWLASLGGAKRLFLGRDFSRPQPLAGYASGFSGTCASWSQSVAANGLATLTLGVPTGQKISIGDYVDFRWTTGGEARRALVRSLEDVTASAGAASFAVEPPVPTLVVPSEAVAHLDSPACLMRLVPGESSAGEMNRRRAVGLAFSGVQVLLP